MKNNHIYSFKIYQFGVQINEVKFKDFDAARDYYCKTYFDFTVATVPYIDGKEIKLSDASKLYELAVYCNHTIVQNNTRKASYYV